ncbi:outer membrane lipoprotein chaperone LolA [Caldimonas thermodepolymerans]|jgi:periplasmic chaperone LolA|uniref:Outer-membrane lipoprotein carrier protein n=1 Tax=Caldimonas thermodepolymerans TaxID=215580 RepID=A0A2S5T0Y1_9BURK|nr:outer membrane lipoprotein chaperone LolA [Caldimonas thermodepolymerans]PPE68633.1 outer membrane lipoprotein carrier protein LolA [Caldimonas thermodepolymerans]QPC30835.1 outer membrane lipoprotein chaperone LolA [Caldimonas thermodepolymerans]RDH94971.1 outer membrane lipoprotein carrier protein [Caldimonas thermodepolymerans]TCP08934.1 outer membrane lipoprotein carrier protein [Caldimonas thermodepolymerans]UZG43575.1 outer membrane lipoprotein chaperone LolA [Caldimonas thermodepolym
MKHLFLTALLAVAMPAWADAVDTLKRFVQEVRSGQAAFTQTVTSPDGAKKRVTQGRFEFARPGRFRFEYDKPFEQLIVADGQKVWLYDPDLHQVTVRAMDQALGATPAALLAGGSLEKDFRLAPAEASDGLQWVEAVPRDKDSQFRTVRVGFRDQALAALEILDNFGQKSVLQFSQVQSNVAVPAERFRFTPPAGADVLEQ